VLLCCVWLLPRHSRSAQCMCVCVWLLPRHSRSAPVCLPARHSSWGSGCRVVYSHKTFRGSCVPSNRRRTGTFTANTTLKRHDSEPWTCTPRTAVYSSFLGRLCSCVATFQHCSISNHVPTGCATIFHAHSNLFGLCGQTCMCLWSSAPNAMYSTSFSAASSYPYVYDHRTYVCLVIRGLVRGHSIPFP